MAQNQTNDLTLVLDISQGVTISNRGDYSMIYKVVMPEIFSLDDQDYQSLNSIFSKAINQLPHGYIFQRLDFFYPDCVKVDIDDTSYLDKRDALYFKERELIQSETYFVFTKLAKLDKRTHYNSGFKKQKQDSSNSKNSVFNKDHYSATELSNLDNNIKKFIEIITTSFNDKTAPITFSRLNDEEMCELILGKYANLELKTGNSNMSSDLVNELDHCKVGDKLVHIISMDQAGMPPQIDTSVSDVEFEVRNVSRLEISTLYKLGYGLDFPHVIHQSYHILNQKETLEDLETLKKQFKAFPGGSYNETRFDSVSQFLYDINSETNFNLIEFSMAVMVITPEYEIEKHRFRISQTTNRLDEIGMKYNLRNNANLFYAFTPGNAGEIPSGDRALTITEWAVTLQIFESNQFSAFRGVRFVDRKFGTPITVDFWDNPRIQNKNRLVLGPSGTGKSFLINHLIRHDLQSECDVVIVDIGYSYSKLCELHNGIMIESKEDKPLMFNPFLNVSRIGNVYQPTQDQIEFISTLLYTAWQCANSKPISNQENKILKEMIRMYFDWLSDCLLVSDSGNRNLSDEKRNSLLTEIEKNPAKTRPCFTGFYHYMIQNFNSTYQSLDYRNFDLQSFQLVMGQYAEIDDKGRKGEYSFLFNPDQNPDIYKEQMVIFELEFIKDNPILFPITALIIMEVVMDKMIKQKNGRRLMFALDEVWKVLQGNMAPFVQYMYKTARKHGGAIMIATQEINDISSNAIGPAIISQSDTTILLPQKLDGEQALREHLQLTESQINLLYSCRMEKKFREVFIKFIDKAFVYRFEVSPHSVGVFTSSAEDKKFIADQVIKTGSLKTAINEFAEKLTN